MSLNSSIYNKEYKIILLLDQNKMRILAISHAPIYDSYSVLHKDCEKYKVRIFLSLYNVPNFM